MGELARTILRLMLATNRSSAFSLMLPCGRRLCKQARTLWRGAGLNQFYCVISLDSSASARGAIKLDNSLANQRRIRPRAYCESADLAES